VHNRREFIRDLAGAMGGVFFVGCDLMNTAANPRQEGQKAKRRQVMVGGRQVRTVDVHSHCSVDIEDLIKDHTVGGSRTGPFGATILKPENVDARLRHMDEHGTDIQAVSPVPSYNYWADRDLASRIVQRQNEQIAAMCTSHPDRFVPMGALALQHPDLAVEEMEYAVKKLGMRGFEISPSVNEEPLSAPKFDPFWAKAEELGILIFIHPVGTQGGQPQFKGNGYLDNVVGHPLETTVALSHLIFEGTLDRHPGVKICGAHGGGYLASYLGRSDHCAEASENCKPIKKHPSEYFRQQLYCDSIVFTAEGLRHLVAEVGARHVLLGTDFPFDIGEPHMGDPRGVDSILGVAGLSDDDQRAILGANASGLLGISS
jgi:predicted TIM-barrel fold metal-dependent hydrolase